MILFITFDKSDWYQMESLTWPMQSILWWQWKSYLSF